MKILNYLCKSVSY